MILDCSFAVLLNFANFEIFAISVLQCFAKFRKSCFASFANTSFARFRKYFFSQFVVCFARFARFCKYEFRKVSQFSVSQEFASRFYVSQVLHGFRNDVVFTIQNHWVRVLVRTRGGACTTAGTPWSMSSMEPRPEQH